MPQGNLWLSIGAEAGLLNIVISLCLFQKHLYIGESPKAVAYLGI
jgi:hypothetical protein